MQAMILAAGMGKRLGDFTQNNTKCMVDVAGKSIIARAIEQLCNLDLARIVVVVGYRKEALVRHIEGLQCRVPVEYVANDDYDRTNNIYSLYLARDWLAQDDTLLLESDLVFDGSLLSDLVDDPWPTLALVDAYEHWMSGTVVKIDENDRISQFVPHTQFSFDEIDEYYKTVNIYKFSREFSETHYIPFLEAYCKALGSNEYYEQVLRVTTMLDDSEMKAKQVAGKRWYEIDTPQDLAIAETLFALDGEQMLDSFMGRYGGYWRYPAVTDFCYLVNPFYPSQRVADRMKESFDNLLRQYPSGQDVNARLAADWLGVDAGQVAVGNGAAELIAQLMGRVEKPVGVVRPTFEEYPNRLAEGDTVAFCAQAPDYAYAADDLMSFFSGSGVRTLVLINPDNPSGNYLPHGQVLRLAEWCRRQDVRLVVDESFVDFADEQGATLFDEGFLAAHPRAVVVKSISKSYGVPGLRLGVMATADAGLLADVKAGLSVWNVNSFGEFFLQIAKRYQQDYWDAMELFRAERARFAQRLGSLPGLRVVPSQANYLMVDLGAKGAGGASSRALAARLISEHSLLVKDLGPKLRCPDRHYLRVAIRTPQDNDRLVAALQECLKALS